MDINYYLAREQMSLIRAAAATDVRVRFTHEELARLYGSRLKGSSYPHRTPLNDNAQAREAC